MKIIEGILATPYARIAIIVSRFNQFINKQLLEGAIDILRRVGQITDDNITVVYVPGAYELPLAACCLTKTDDYDAIIAIGTIIRGDTPHFEYVATQCSRGLSQVGLHCELPVIFGVLTTDSIEQAIERAGIKVGNKGAEAAMSALEMINVLQAIKQ